MCKNKCIFLDRDGTINIYRELLSKIEDFKLEDKAIEAIKLINSSEYLSIVVTNQPVVARNLCTFQDVWQINRKLKKILAYNGAYVDDIFICPHHPDAGYPEENKKYKIKCNCRKPDTGMIDLAVEKYDIDLGQSFIIGDSTIDIEMGRRAGMKTILVSTGIGGMDKIYDVKPDYLASNLYDAVMFVLNNNKLCE